MKRVVISVTILTSLLLVASCGENPLNTEIDPAGTYQMTIEYPGENMECTLVLEPLNNGIWKATWDYGSDSPDLYENTAVCFGEKYLAVCEQGDPAIIDIFTVGDGALNGYWLEYGSDELYGIYGVSEEGNPLPNPPVLTELESPGNYNVEGSNDDGSTYVGYQYLDTYGKVITCDQTITPDYEADQYYQGVGAIVDGHLVLAVTSFLSVYTPSGNDWNGVWVDYTIDEVMDESLSFTAE